MKRSPLERRTPIKRTPFRPRTRGRVRRIIDAIVAVFPTRRSKRFDSRRDDGYRAWVRQQPCVCGMGLTKYICAGRVECAHVRSRGAGGDDRGNCVPLCTWHHREQHAVGIKTFAREYGLDLKAIALDLLADYEQEYGA